MTYLDIARGIATIFVVLHHVIAGTSAAGIIQNNSGIVRFDSAFGIWKMPLFFLLSGIFIPKLFPLDAKTIIKNRIFLVGWPFMLWGTIQTTVMLFMSEMTNSKTSVWDVLLFPLLPKGQFWFLEYLFVITITYGAFLKKSQRISIVISVATILLSSAYIGDRFGWQYRVIMGLGWSAMGCFLATSGMLEKFAKRLNVRTTVLFSIGFSVIASLTPSESPLLVLGITFGVLSIFGIGVQIDKSNAGMWLSLLGKNSLGIYLMHILFCAGIRILLRGVFDISNPTVHLFIGWGGGVCGPLLFVLIAKRIGWGWLFALNPCYLRKEAVATPSKTQTLPVGIRAGAHNTPDISCRNATSKRILHHTARSRN